MLWQSESIKTSKTLVITRNYSVPVLTIILMTIFGISYQTYAEDTQWIVNFGSCNGSFRYTDLSLSGKRFVKPRSSYDCDYCGHERRRDDCL